MGHIVMKILPFVMSVFGHWQVWLSGGGLGGIIVIAVGVVERFWGKSLSKRTYAYLFLVVFFLCSCFLSWVDRDDALSNSEQQRLNEHRDEEASLNQLQGSYGELKAQCSYQTGVMDTLGKQNRDQQNTINNCQTQALKLLSPPEYTMHGFSLDGYGPKTTDTIAHYI